MNVEKLSLKKQQYYAIYNILQSIRNAQTYCSYLGIPELRWELEEMIRKFQKRVERKINDNL